jgi:hypothetical protein
MYGAAEKWTCRVVDTRFGGFVAPEQLNEAFSTDDVVGVKQHDGQQNPLLASTERD